MKYVDAIGSNIQLGNNAVILYFDEGFTDYVVIADTGSISPCSFDVDEENEELVFTFCGETAYEKASKKSTDLIIEDNALENIGVMAGSNQATINRQLDLLFGRERTIDSQLSCSSSNPVENKVITNALRLKQDLLESGINIKTINNQTILGAGNINIEGGGGSVEIVTAWEDTPSDEKVPSEKLAKSSLDGKANISHFHTISNITDLGAILNAKANIEDIPVNISDLNNDSDFIEKSNTSGLIRNDGTIDITNYSTFTGDYNDLTNKPTIPVVPSLISAFTNDVGYLTQHQSLANYIQKSNTSGLIRNDGSIDTSNYSTFSGSYIDLTNKPNIPSAISDLTNDSDFIETSTTSGLIRNDGTIDATNYLSSLPVHTHDDRYYTETEIDTALNTKQDTLISGTNIKTINNTSILGAGNISIQGGGSITVDSTWITGSTNPAESQLIQSALDDKTDVGHTHDDFEINSSYTNIEMGTLILATLNDVIEYNEPFTRINRALEHMLDNWEDYD